MNKVILIGNLGKDPELTYTQAGSAKCKFSMATTKVRKNESGEKTETTFWHQVVSWGNQAESCGKFLKKGSKVAVDGEIESRSYDDKDGVKKYITEINAHHVEFLGGRGDAPAGQGNREEGAPRSPQPRGNAAFGPGKPKAPPPPADIDDDDSIPF